MAHYIWGLFTAPLLVEFAYFAPSHSLSMYSEFTFKTSPGGLREAFKIKKMHIL